MTLVQNKSGQYINPATDDNQTDGSQKTQIVGATGTTAEVNDTGQLHTVMRGTVCAGCTTETPLGIDGVFTGTSIDTLDYSAVTVFIRTDQASITNGLSIQYSSDEITWHDGETYTINADTQKFYTPTLQNKYMRVKYTNGAVAQTAFQIETILRKNVVKWSSHNIEDPIKNEDDAELVKAVITGKRVDGVYENVNLTNGNNMKVSLEELETGISSNSNSQLNVTPFDSTGAEIGGKIYDNVTGTYKGLNFYDGQPVSTTQDYLYAIAEGDIPGHEPLLKFGTRESVAAGVSSVIWEGPTDLYVDLPSAEILKITSTSANDIAVTGTGARTLMLEGLDASYNEVSDSINMNGLTAVNSNVAFLRINRAYVITCGTGYTNAGIINIKNNASTVTQLLINIGDGQSLISRWTVPLGKTAYLVRAGISTNSNKGARISFFARKLDGGILYPWLIKYRGYIFSGAVGVNIKIPFKVPEKTDLEMRVLTPVSAGVTSVGGTFELWYE